MNDKFELAISICGDNSIIAPIVVSIVCSNSNNITNKKLSSENFDKLLIELKKDFYFIETCVIFPNDIYSSIDETIKYFIKKQLQNYKKLSINNTIIIDGQKKNIYANKVANFISNNLRKKFLKSLDYFYPFLNLTKNNGNYTDSLINKLKKIDYDSNIFIISEDEFDKLKTK